MLNYAADVAVIGAGVGGVSAAYHCAKAGLRVLLFEASDGFGPALEGVNGVFAVGTDYQKSKHVNIDKRELFWYLMNHANWTIDARQVTEFLNRSAGAWAMLESMGCGAEELIAYNLTSPHTWHYLDCTKPGLTVLGDAFLAAGGQLISRVYMDHLLTEDGRCVGAAGETAEGEQLEVRCDAVVLATGEPKPLPTPDGPPAPPGPGGRACPDGISMALAVGAGRRPDGYSAFSMNVKPPAFNVPDAVFPGPTEQYFRQPQELMVNRNGRRFTTEEIIHAMEDGASVIACQPGGIMYSIFDTRLLHYWKKWGWSSYKYKYGGEGAPQADFDAQWETAKQNGYSIYDGDTPGELADAMGVPADVLEHTLEHYNKICESGRDTEFYKKPEYLIPLVGPHYYAIKVFGVLSPVGGPLCADWTGQILDGDGRAIPGLFGAGGTVSFLNGRVYTHTCAGSRSAFGMVSGEICGETIPAYLRTRHKSV